MRIFGITTHALGKRFGLTGQPLWLIRRKLQRLSYLSSSPSQRGGRTYIVHMELPYSASAINHEYSARFYTVSVDSAIADAQSEIYGLAEQMREWSDNMDSGGLGSTDLYDRVTDSADALEEQESQLASLDLPSVLSGVSVTASPVYDVWLLKGRSRQLGRGRILANTLAVLLAVVDEAELWVKPDSEIKEFEEDEDTCSQMAADNEDLEEWIQQLRDIIDELEAVEFPGAYG